MWKVILFAHDFSECAGRVEPLVRELSRTMCAKIVVCHVSSDLHGLPPETIIQPPGEEGPKRVRDYVLDKARDRLERIAEKLRRECVTTEVDARLGDISEGILAAARDARAEVIVMGTHGRRGLEHLFLGSVAEKVVRTAPCPVLTVRHPEHDFVTPDALVTTTQA